MKIMKSMSRETGSSSCSKAGKRCRDLGRREVGEDSSTA